MGYVVMGVRIYERDLDSIVEDINLALLDTTINFIPTEISISCAYGGYKAVYVKGQRDVFSTGHITKRDLYFRLAAYLLGLQVQLDNK